MNARTLLRRSTGAAFLAAFAALPAVSLADSSDYFTHQLNRARYPAAESPQPSYSARMQAARSPSEVVELKVHNGEVVEGPAAISVDHGNQVTMVIESDRPDVVTVDGYGYRVPVAPGEPAILSFNAERPGRFAYRMSRSGERLGVIEVGPAI